jgi:predicted small secreted protein
VNKEEKMKKIFVIAALLAVLVIAGCTTTTTVPVDVSNNPIGSKVGEQSESVTIILGIIPFSYSIDTSAYKAAQNGGISRIATVDYRTETVNMFVLRKYTYTTIVTGE